MNPSLRRLRRTPALRRLFTETRLSRDNLIEPFFVVPGKSVRAAIPSMPAVYRFSVDTLLTEVEETAKLGIPAVLLFGVPDKKDPRATLTAQKTGVVPTAIKALKKAFPDLVVMTDVCVCSYTNHGHCGIVVGGEVDNDATLPILAKMAVSHADAGADVVAPSAMMDNQVAAIRAGLDAAGHTKTLLLSYAAKFASAFYGPFRDAATSTPQFGDRRGYQMAPPNVREALREIEVDIAQGADAVMVKPALAYLDVIRAARERFPLPLAAYNVSGEYAMLKAASANGWIEEERAMLEMLTAIRRAGADTIITYFARAAARMIG
ncbi:MAG: porphobilinogen synthase [Deltaproteobacteria bacterium]|nr:porphobilinogen synthase [Deltaproteobacteria bacterium]